MPPAQHYPESTVGALIFDPEGRLFLMRSHKWAGQYVVPGGHVELGETLEAALRREVAEETGLTIHDIRFVCTQEFIYDPTFWQPRHFVFFDYACHADQTEVRLNDEAEEYTWATVDEALRLPVAPSPASCKRACRCAGQGGRSAGPRPAPDCRPMSQERPRLRTPWA